MPEPLASILKRMSSVVVPNPIGSYSYAHQQAKARRSKAIHKCAAELGKAMKLEESQYWQRQIPKALFDVLDDFDEAAAIVAAETYLSRFGWKIERALPPTEADE
jgi:hypothetical protein